MTVAGRRRTPSDPELLRAAIAAAGFESRRRFAENVLRVDEIEVHSWLNADREMPSTVRIVCAAIIERPALAGELEATAALLRGGHIGRGLTTSSAPIFSADGVTRRVREYPGELARAQRRRTVRAEGKQS